MIDDKTLIVSFVALGILQGILFEVGKRYIDRSALQFPSMNIMIIGLLIFVLIAVVGVLAFSLPIIIFSYLGLIPSTLNDIKLAGVQWYWLGGICLGFIPLRFFLSRRYP